MNSFFLANLGRAHSPISLESMPAVGIGVPAFLCCLAICAVVSHLIRPRIQFFLSDLMIAMLSIAVCTTLQLYISRHFFRHFEEMDLRDPIAIIVAPIPAVIMSVLWFVLGCLIAWSYDGLNLEQTSRRGRMILLAVFCCFGGNALWLGLSVTNQLMGS